LKRILDDGKCEIGMHCHPWNTPPFNKNEVVREQDTMLCNLPADLIDEKLEHLHEAICQNFETRPVSFRAGRWGFNLNVARSLSRLGYLVDTSVTPFVSWRAYHGPDFSEFDPSVFKFFNHDLGRENEKDFLLEVPATIGFLQPNYKLCGRLLKVLQCGISRKLHLVGILYVARILNKVWLSPEFSDSDLMIKLAKRMEKNKYKIINFTFHSSSLERGMSPFVRTDEDKEEFFKRIDQFLSFITRSRFEAHILAKSKYEG
jgi:hypothetical protein